MENKDENYIKEKLKSFISKEQIEKIKQITIFNIKINDYLSKKNAKNIIITLFVIIVFYFVFIKGDNSELLNTLEKKILEEKNYFFTDIKQSELINIINNNKINSHENLIIGIKFGNIYTSYSYNLGKNISTIVSEKKSSTELELSKETKKGLKHSYKASVSLTNYNINELKSIIFYKGFKSLLYEDGDGKNNNMYYQYNSDKIGDTNIILKEYFTLLKNGILLNLDKKYKNIPIKWIFAIPENLNQYEKQLIKNITTELEMYNLNFIYESDASSLAMYNDRSIPFSVKQQNKTFMLIDAGGHSIDITIYKILDEQGTLKQIMQTQSLNLGIFDISNKIINVFKEIFGEKEIEKVKKNEPGEWIKILNDINKIIENTYRINGIEEYEINNFLRKKEGNFTFDNQTIKINKFNINFPLSLSGKFISENIDLLNEKINEIIQELKKKQNLNINNIIVTGGLSRNKIFKEKLKSNFSEDDNFIHYLSSYENDISKGAVFYGMNPDKIKNKISPITLGIRKNDIKNKKENIELLIKKGEEMKNINLVKYIKPKSTEQKYIKINIYLSKDDYKDLKELENNLQGAIILKLDENQKGFIKLIINYDITINFFAYYENGKDVESFLEYYKL